RPRLDGRPAARSRSRGRDAGPRVAGRSRRVGVPDLCGGRVRGLRSLRHTRVLRRPLPHSPRVVVGIMGTGLGAPSERDRHRGRMSLHRECRQRRSAARPGSSCRLRAMGHRAAADRRPSRALRRWHGTRQDRGRGTPALPRRPSWRRPLTESDLRDRIRLALIRFVLCVGGGFTLGLAYPAIDWAGTAWIALVPFFYVAVTAPPRSAFGWGWLAGIAFFLTLLRWLNFTFRTYSDIPWPLTWAPTMALAGYCALYFGLVAAGMGLVARRRGAGWGCLAAPLPWGAGGWLRAPLLRGFPWGGLGPRPCRPPPP